MRLAGAVLLAVLVGLPLTVLPSPPVTWLGAGALIVGGAGVVVLSVPLLTIGASVALIALALALVITRRPIDLVTAIAFGITLVLLLALVHLASHAHRAALGRAVIAAQLRGGLTVVLLGAGAAVALMAAGAELAPLLHDAAFPVVVIVAGLGALATVAGVIVLVTSGKDGGANGA